MHARGFTLMEVLGAMLLMLIVTAAMFSAYRFQLFALKTQEAQLEVQETGRNLIDLMAREIRLAGYDPTCVKNFAGVADARPQLLQVQFDRDASGAIGTGESIVYAYNADLDQIQRSAGGAPVALATGLPDNALAFTFFDGTGATLTPSGNPAALTTTQRNAIRRVKITLMLQQPSPDPQSSTPLISRFVSNVELRNRFLHGSAGCP